MDRIGAIVVRRDHNGDPPRFEPNCPKRRARGFTVSLDLPPAAAPRSSGLKRFLIRDNVVSGIYPRRNSVGDRRIHTTFVSELDHEQIRLRWSNARLCAVQIATLATRLPPRHPA